MSIYIISDVARLPDRNRTVKLNNIVRFNGGSAGVFSEVDKMYTRTVPCTSFTYSVKH